MPVLTDEPREPYASTIAALYNDGSVDLRFADVLAAVLAEVARLDREHPLATTPLKYNYGDYIFEAALAIREAQRRRTEGT